MSRLLVEGLSGDDVKMLQAVLNYHRVLPTDEVLPTTGFFGSMTKRRVESFQAQNHLHVDGKVGPNTAGMLMTICNATAEYEVLHDYYEVPIGGGTGDDPGVSTHYELEDGITVELNPWESPPAKLKYRLEYAVSWVVKNPGLPAPFTLEVGAEISPTLFTHSLDSDYAFGGGGHVKGIFKKELILGPIKLDPGIQAGFELEHETGAPEVQLSAAASLAAGLTFTVLRDRFYLFTQGELGAAVHWHDGTLQTSPQLEGKAGITIKF